MFFKGLSMHAWHDVRGQTGTCPWLSDLIRFNRRGPCSPRDSGNSTRLAAGGHIMPSSMLQS